MHTSVSFLEYIAYQLRRDSLEATTQAGSGHPTSCLSAADIISVLFLYAMQKGDKFILSKGHAAPLLYSVYKELGLISQQELLTLRTFGSPLEGHPTPRFKYVSVATGSLGQGISIGLGMVLAQRVTGKNGTVFVMIGDAELAEGSNWEAAELSTHYMADKLVVILDANRWGQSTQSIDGHDLDIIARKWEAFGWHVYIIDGHSASDLCAVFAAAREIRIEKPIIIIARTFKGYGLNDAIEDYNGYHGRAFSFEELPGLLKKLHDRFPSAAHYQLTEHDSLMLNSKRALHDHRYIYEKHMIGMPESRYMLGELIAPRKACGQALAQASKVASHLVVFDGDVKNSTYTDIFEAQAPDRFFQGYVAEQNMIGMGEGAAVSNTLACVSTFAAFLTRAHDQLRMCAIAGVPLKVIGSHAGVSVGQDGPSQMGLEDIALMRTLPESLILQPCDAVSAWACVGLMLNYTDGIGYVRMLRGATPVIYDNNHQFQIGGCAVLRASDQDQACVVASGVTVPEALHAYELLLKRGIPVRIIDCYSIKPLPIEALKNCMQETCNRMITVEDHYIQGGLGEAITYELRNMNAHIECLAVRSLPTSGTPEELRAYEKIDFQAIINAVENIISL